jgi:hypothetical protein
MVHDDFVALMFKLVFFMLHVETGKYGHSTESADRWYVKYGHTT